MTMPFSYVEASQLMGSWPMAPTLGPSSTPTMVPGALIYKARILGIARETTAGFDVVGRSFRLTVDAGSSVSISFTGSGNLTLDQVITQINTIVGSDVAKRDNRFLLLESTTSGEGSYLKIEVDPASTPTNVLNNLGLFADCESRAGDLASPEHIDPERQLALPHQLSFMQGESFDANAFNRVAFQLAINSDYQYGLLAKRRQAKVKEVEVVNPGTGLTVADTIYTGADITPTPEQIENFIMLLDTDGSEVLAKNESVIRDDGDWVLSWDPDQEKQFVSGWDGFNVFDPSDVALDHYFKSDDPAMGVLQGVRLKIIEFIDINQVVVRAVNPATGEAVHLDTTHIPGQYLEVITTHILVDGLWTNSGMTTRVEGSPVAKATRSITRIEGTNRIVCVGANFLSSPAVVIGDTVAISGHTISNPYSNNGDYRVSKVVDKETLDLVNDTYGPVFLNNTGGLGTAVVTSDGAFYPNPYASFNVAVPAGTYRLLYKELSTLEEILDDVDGLSGDLFKYQQETSAAVEAALIRITGPSVHSINEILYNSEIPSVEDLTYRVGMEHDDVGRHSTIRPNIITQGLGTTALGYPSVAYTIYNDPSEDDDTDLHKIELYRSSGEGYDDILFYLDATGGIRVKNSYEETYSHLSPLGYLKVSAIDGDNKAWVTAESDAPAMFIGIKYNGPAGMWLESWPSYQDLGQTHGDPANASVFFAGGDNDPQYQSQFAINLVAYGEGDSPSMLKLDCYNNGDGTTMDAMMTWVADIDGFSSGIYNTDPGYNSRWGGRLGAFEIYQDDYMYNPAGWTFVSHSSSANTDDSMDWGNSSFNRNHILFLREVDDYGDGYPTAGTVLGGLAFGGRFGPNRGDFTYGWDGGCEISAIASTSWDPDEEVQSFGADLYFYTTGWDNIAEQRLQIYSQGLIVGVPGDTGYRIAIAGLTSASYWASSLCYGDTTNDERFVAGITSSGFTYGGFDNYSYLLGYFDDTYGHHPVFVVHPSSYGAASYEIKMMDGKVVIDNNGSTHLANGNYVFNADKSASLANNTISISSATYGVLTISGGYLQSTAYTVAPYSGSTYVGQLLHGAAGTADYSWHFYTGGSTGIAFGRATSGKGDIIYHRVSDDLTTFGNGLTSGGMSLTFTGANANFLGGASNRVNFGSSVGSPASAVHWGPVGIGVAPTNSWLHLYDTNAAYTYSMYVRSDQRRDAAVYIYATGTSGASATENRALHVETTATGPNGTSRGIYSHCGGDWYNNAVYGEAHGYAAWPHGTARAVEGRAYDAAEATGVYGYGNVSISALAAYGGYFVATAVSGAAAIGCYSDADVSFWGTGTKYWVNPHPADSTKLVAYQTVEAGDAKTFYSGRAALVMGKAIVVLPDHFSLVTDSDMPVLVTLTPRNSGSKGLSAVASSPSVFTVEELNMGSGSYEFDYVVTGTRIGYEKSFPIQENISFVPYRKSKSEGTTQAYYDARPGLRKNLIRNKTLNQDGTVNKSHFKKMGWAVVEAHDQTRFKVIDGDETTIVRKDKVHGHLAHPQNRT